MFCWRRRVRRPKVVSQWDVSVKFSKYIIHRERRRDNESLLKISVNSHICKAGERDRGRERECVRELESTRVI